ncbi:MAG TPA: PQQ-binding-like beta-propeller repeat protein, partial [Planctomycetaceae bacterium]|nr:PQQ-binding-like beta-propeller repeat protein [Planctomycetaceae bacterium]
SVDDLLEAKEWARAIDILESTISTAREQVIAVGEGHSLNGSEYARVLLTRLPAPALMQYRTRKEAQAAEWLRSATANRDPQLLEAIVEEAFLTRSAEQALLLLGEWSFQAGEFAQARRWWTMLVPLELVPGRPSTLIRFPDPETAQSDVLARLVLCSILEGNVQRAKWELHFFTKRFPDANGALAGEAGLWSELLSNFVESQFGDTNSTDGQREHELSVGRPRWQAPLDPDSASPVAAIIPGVSNNLILWNTHRELYAAQLETGHPAWIVDPPQTPEKWFRLSRLFPPGPRTSVQVPGREIFGSTTASVTIADGRAYFRSGGPVSAYSPEEFRRTDSTLICLDLEEGEGLLRWKVDTNALDDQAQLRFAGPPIVLSERVYILGRRGLLPSELHLICLNRDDGQFLWSRFVCSNSPLIPAGANLAECLRLTASDDQLVVSSKMGCLASFSLPNGRPRWYHTYASRNEAVNSSTTPGSIEQGLIHRDLVFAAPGDGREVFALDLATGDTIWTQPAARREEILGAVETRLLTMGDSLICRHIADGQILWKYSPTTAETQLEGRTLLFAGEIWWPTHREILVFDHRSGQMTRRIPLADRDSLHGGNLLTDGTHFIISGAQNVTVFSPFGSGPPAR